MVKNINKIFKKSDTLAINELRKQQESTEEQIYKFGFGESLFSLPNFCTGCLSGGCSTDILF